MNGICFFAVLLFIICYTHILKWWVITVVVIDSVCLTFTPLLKLMPHNINRDIINDNDGYLDLIWIIIGWVEKCLMWLCFKCYTLYQYGKDFILLKDRYFIRCIIMIINFSCIINYIFSMVIFRLSDLFRFSWNTNIWC